jgi:hypothetical protein
MSVLKPGVLAFGYYRPRVSTLEPQYQDVFIKAYFGYSKQLVYTYLSMMLSVFAAIAFFTINLTFSILLVIMSVFIILFGVFLIQLYSSNLEHLLQSLEDRELTPDYTYEGEHKTRRHKR